MTHALRYLRNGIEIVDEIEVYSYSWASGVLLLRDRDGVERIMGPGCWLELTSLEFQAPKPPKDNSLEGSSTKDEPDRE